MKKTGKIGRDVTKLVRRQMRISSYKFIRMRFWVWMPFNSRKASKCQFCCT